MNRLRLSLSAITPSGANIHVALSTADLQPEGVEEQLPGSVSVTGVLTEAGGEYLFRGTVSGAFDLKCDRCLEDARHLFSADVCWTYVESATPVAPGMEVDGMSGDETVHPFTGNEIDLAPEVWEEVVLAAPAKALCRSDCAGLCPRCGMNWNHGKCACRTTEELDRKGLAGLASLYPNLKPNRPEE
ncbi:MAG TPA: DUF177 domain-containing protein [Candidatus Hydrogenedentes bacterium]|nr:DUF177 domain-containing protein [Candidatus Hydrogenedentota bacterium]HOV73400.1 DUF177 domain-containing protein [Candidatus Hydrogenedentota bacterium]HPC18116.1 DUF177 domain-containing protein [Candidatus Hydrogenedentota bacterium]HRT20644.1 DUF177 domain-containing protein [Candidatus Hydrogenedentota bacterium]HRT65679.1 DUF177 domain-containing protein [Candidatus Hydrogenedentota bacterium]